MSPSRFVAIGASVLLTSTFFACGADEGTGDAPESGFFGADAGPPLPASTCEKDEDCSGGECAEIGGGQRACVRAKSCTGGSGANRTCGGAEGANGKYDCCQTLGVPGGTYDRFNDKAFPARVEPFLLDAFEVTAGRFRAWVEETNGNLRANAPRPGGGAHPRIANSGWRAEWTSLLPASRSEVDQLLGPEKCKVGANLDDYGALTWWTPALDAKVKRSNAGNSEILAANTKEALDGKPLNCVPWYVLFAFCAWDGGRLPTDAEWGYAAAGGSEHRAFPWGSVAAKDVATVGQATNVSPAPLFAAGSKHVVAFLWDPPAGPNQFPAGYVYTWGTRFAGRRDNASHIAPVGSRPAGNGKWGHADLAGGMYEWTLDEGPVVKGRCEDCANVAWPSPTGRDPKIPRPFPLEDFHDEWFAGGARSVRGGAWDNALGLSNAQTLDEIEIYTSYPVQRTYRSLGGRCARDP